MTGRQPRLSGIKKNMAMARILLLGVYMNNGKTEESCKSGNQELITEQPERKSSIIISSISPASRLSVFLSR